MTTTASDRCGDGDYQPADVQFLAERARQRDQDAWEALFRLAYPRLLAYARRRLPDGESAKDAVAETMARAVRSIDRFVWKGGGFEAWLFGIMRHVVIDAQRARRVDLLPDVDLTTSLEAGPLERLVGDEEADRVRAAFLRLSSGDREVLELRVLGGMTSEEVAAVLGRRPGAVRMAQARALERLRRLLGDW